MKREFSSSFQNSIYEPLNGSPSVCFFAQMRDLTSISSGCTTWTMDCQAGDADPISGTAPWLAVWPGINHLHLSISPMARQLLKHSLLSPVSQPLTCYRLENRTVVSLVRGIRQSVTHFFWYDWITLDKSTRGSEADGVVFHFIQLKKWKKFSKPRKHSQNTLVKFWEVLRIRCLVFPNIYIYLDLKWEFLKFLEL